jgi:hypothetical protein
MNEAKEVLLNRDAQYKARHMKMLEDKTESQILAEYCNRFLNLPEESFANKSQEVYLLVSMVRNLSMAMKMQNEGKPLTGMHGILGYMDIADDRFESFLFETIGKKLEGMV